jgi:hypothetical protein
MTTTTVDPNGIVTYRAWWPAAALLPDRSVMHRVRVYATNAGLLIYSRVPETATPEWGALTPDWSSPIDWQATPRPASAALPGQSYSIHTRDGLVVITHIGGCGCGTRLKTWRPQFSTHTATWPTTGSETTP